MQFCSENLVATMRYTRCIILPEMFKEVWIHFVILVAGGLETVPILQEIYYYPNVIDANEAETEKGSLCLN